jgi:hypothetical protein
MPLERYDRVTRVPGRGADGRSSLLGSATGWGSKYRVGSAIPIEGREGLVKARLNDLLVTLGEVPAPRQLTVQERGAALASALATICPAGLVVIHGRRLPRRTVTLEHLVIASRGIVVVGAEWVPLPVDGDSPRRSVLRVKPSLAHQGGELAPPRSFVVRQTLRRVFALRAWLSETPWAATAVLAAVCSTRAGGAAPHPGVLLDGLWSGPAGRLGSWLAEEGNLDEAARHALGCFLSAQLPFA